MKLRIASMTIECADVRRLGEFWAAALDYVPRGALTEQGGIGGGVIEDPNDRDVELVFIRVPEGQAVQRGARLILGADDLGAEVERLTGLGATRLEGSTSGLPGIVMSDPEGNLFSVFPTDPDNRLSTWRT